MCGKADARQNVSLVDLAAELGLDAPSLDVILKGLLSERLITVNTTGGVRITYEGVYVLEHKLPGDPARRSAKWLLEPSERTSAPDGERETPTPAARPSGPQLTRPDSLSSLPAVSLPNGGRLSDPAMRPVSGAHPRNDSVTAAIVVAARSALERAMETGQNVSLVIRRDPTSGMPVRTIEGVVADLFTSRDGRERVTIRIAEDAEQVVLLERILRVIGLP